MTELFKGAKCWDCSGPILTCYDCKGTVIWCPACEEKHVCTPEARAKKLARLQAGEDVLLEEGSHGEAVRVGGEESPGG